MSRFWLHECENGGIKVGYETYGEMDREVTYSIDPENLDKLKKVLENIGHKGTLEEMIEEECGSYLFDFDVFCDKNGIQYQRFVWVS